MKLRLDSFLGKSVGKSFSSTAAVVVQIADMTADAKDNELPPVPYFKVTILSLVAISIPFLSHGLSPKVNVHPWIFRVIWAVAFMINCVTVSLPGRFDNELNDGKIAVPWRSLFEPSSWAFSIWAVIYLSEFLLTTYSIVYGIPTIPFRSSSVYWLAANLYQSLWCLSFRPDFARVLFLPALFLASGCTALLFAYLPFHRQFLEILAKPSFPHFLPLVLPVFPLALHATWLAGATLLNINVWASIRQIAKSNQIGLAFFSAFATALFGCFASLLTLNPFFAWTSGWALSALSERSSQCQLKTFDVDTQKALSNTEHALMRVTQLAGLMVSIASVVRYTQNSA